MNSKSRTPLSGASAAPAPDARRTPRRSGLAPLRDAVGIAGEHRAAEFVV